LLVPVKLRVMLVGPPKSDEVHPTPTGQEGLFRSTTLTLPGKETRNRPGVAQRVPGGLGSQIFMTFGT
jgi:hypothetical protein